MEEEYLFEASMIRHMVFNGEWIDGIMFASRSGFFEKDSCFQIELCSFLKRKSLFMSGEYKDFYNGKLSCHAFLKRNFIFGEKIEYI